MKVRLASNLQSDSIVDGDGIRTVIWFQGCNIHCQGCCNKSLQALVPNHILGIEELVNIVKDAKEKFNLEGITLSGGEPSLQKGLKYFNDEIHKLGLGIILFSGKSKDELDSELVNSVDLLIDGPFIESKLDNKRLLLGSTNKHLNFITERYKKYEEYFYNLKSLEEVTVDDYIFINGD